MESKWELLRSEGYELIAAAGCYCRAMREEHEVLLRWDGEEWIVM